MRAVDTTFYPTQPNSDASESTNLNCSGTYPMTYRYRIQYPKLDCRTSRPLTSLKLAAGLAEILFFSLVQFPCVEGRVALDKGPKLSHRLQTFDRKCKGMRMYVENYLSTWACRAH